MGEEKAGNGWREQERARKVWKVWEAGEGRAERAGKGMKGKERVGSGSSKKAGMIYKG